MSLIIRPIVNSQFQQKTNQSTKLYKQNVSFRGNLFLEACKHVEDLRKAMDAAADPTVKKALKEEYLQALMGLQAFNELQKVLPSLRNI